MLRRQSHSGILSLIFEGMDILFLFLLFEEYFFSFLSICSFPIFCRYMAEQVPLTAVDVDAGVKVKFSDLVADAGSVALWILLMGHAMELKHGVVEAQCKEATEDVEKWKHKATSMEARLKEALKDKKVAEKESGEMKEEK